MKMNIYSVYDSQAQAFMTPFFLPMDGMAIRAITDQVNAKDQNMVSTHPQDYTLFGIGEYDDQTGYCEKYEQHVNLGNAASFKTEVPRNEEEIFQKIEGMFRKYLAGGPKQ